MQTPKAALIRALLSRTSSAALLLVSLSLATPALSATHLESHCDRNETTPASFEVPVEQLIIKVIDLGDARSTAADELEASEPTSLTELTIPVSDSEAAEAHEEDDTTADDTGPPTANTRFPGISDEESQRYRRQMFRTDI